VGKNLMSRGCGARIQVGRRNGVANQMFRYAYARGLQALIPGSVVTGFDLPMFGLTADVETLEGRVLHVVHGHRHSMHTIASLVNRGVYDHVLLDGFVQRMEFYPDPAELSALFPPLPPVDTTHLGPDRLVVNVRAAELLGNVHPDYGPVPVAYFRHVADSTGLQPVVMGQLGDDFYSEAIRRCFTGCVVLPSHSPAEDFQRLMSAANVVIGVSTFSWLACWMSCHVRTVHMPVKGLFHPVQRPDVDLLPVGDARYRFHGFPVERWVSGDDQRHRLVSDEFAGPMLTHAQVRQMIGYVSC
jgi:hypothetical protein